jgi:hypothetical protein
MCMKWETRQRPIAYPWLIQRFVDSDAEFLFAPADEVLDSANPALEHLAHIVRGADTAELDLTPESHGLLAIAQGFSLAYADDHEQLQAEMPVYDALYACCQRQAGHAISSSSSRRAAPTGART